MRNTIQKRLLMSRARIPLVVAMLLLVATVIILGTVSAQSTAITSTEASEGYYFGEWNPGHTYHIQYTKYKRYGPLKATMESNSRLLFGPETAATDLVVEIDSSGGISKFNQIVASPDGQKWYTYSLSEAGEYAITDHQTKSHISQTLPSQALQKSEQVRPHYANVLSNLGWQFLGDGFFNGRRTQVYSITDVIEEKIEPPIDGEYVAPVVYDLAPNRIRTESQVDALSGVVIQYARYAIDVKENETLIESFELKMLRQEK